MASADNADSVISLPLCLRERAFIIRGFATKGANGVILRLLLPPDISMAFPQRKVISKTVLTNQPLCSANDLSAMDDGHGTRGTIFFPDPLDR